MFFHGYLLAGLVLAGVPIVVHLIMRQKPRPLPFPAFRFLQRRQVTNQRRLRLQHLLLLLLRMLVIVLLCLFLARPRPVRWLVASEHIALSNERPVVAVLVFDTSSSMGYLSGGRTALDQAQEHGRELLDLLAPESRVALLSTGSAYAAEASPSDWLRVDLARERLGKLRLRPASGSLLPALRSARRLLAQAPSGPENPPRFLVVFSDRTRGCWNPSAQLPTMPDGVQVLFLDVGQDRPEDLAIEKVKVVPATPAPGTRVRVEVTVRSTGRDHENELICKFGHRDVSPMKQAFRLTAGQAATYLFEHSVAAINDGGLADIPRQVQVELGTLDALPFNNSHFQTFVVRTGRKVLVVAERPREADIWRIALESTRRFTVEVRTPEKAEQLSPSEWATYKVVCLFQVRQPSLALWDRLQTFVQRGGGLALIPDGQGLVPHQDAFNKRASERNLLPGRLQALVATPGNRPLRWADLRGQHPLIAPFERWSRNANPDFTRQGLKPAVRRYWKVDPLGQVIARFQSPSSGDPGAAGERTQQPDPALLERSFPGGGKVLLFTTPMDDRLLDPQDPNGPRLHNYWDFSSFGLVLADQSCRYLAGDSSQPEVNFYCGQPVRLMLRQPLPAPPYTLDGPELTIAESNLPRPENTGKLPIPQARAPGNYQVYGKQGEIAGCSLNVPPRESQLQRVPKEEIESVLGEGSVVSLHQGKSLVEAFRNRRPPTVDLLPWLLLALILFLVGESLLANRFYRKPTPQEGDAGTG